MANGVDIARGHRYSFTGWQAGVLGEAMAAHPDETISWLQALPAGTDRDRLLEKGLDDALWRAPKYLLFKGADPLAMKLFNQLPEDGQIRVASALGAERAGRGDLTDLGAWAQTFSSPAVRTKAITGVINAAYARDASTIEPLLATITSTPDRDSALAAIVVAMKNDSPSAAADRALSINDEAQRRSSLELAIQSWQKRDPDASRAWIAENPSIPQAWKTSWLQGR
jgi:hypothetical protein